MIFDLFRLDGKVALVTGATRGIGLGIVEALSDAGAHVILSSRVPKPDVVQRFKDLGRQVDYLQGDASKAQRVLGWAPTVTLPQLVDMMVDHDLEKARGEQTLLAAGHGPSWRAPSGS